MGKLKKSLSLRMQNLPFSKKRKAEAPVQGSPSVGKENVSCFSTRENQMAHHTINQIPPVDNPLKRARTASGRVISIPGQGSFSDAEHSASNDTSQSASDGLPAAAITDRIPTVHVQDDELVAIRGEDEHVPLVVMDAIERDNAVMEGAGESDASTGAVTEMGERAIAHADAIAGSDALMEGSLLVSVDSSESAMDIGQHEVDDSRNGASGIPAHLRHDTMTTIEQRTADAGNSWLESFLAGLNPGTANSWFNSVVAELDRRRRGERERRLGSEGLGDDGLEAKYSTEDKGIWGIDEDFDLVCNADWTMPSNDDEDAAWICSGEAFDVAAGVLDGMNDIVMIISKLAHCVDHQLEDDIMKRRVLERIADELGNAANTFRHAASLYFEAGAIDSVVDAFDEAEKGFKGSSTMLHAFLRERNGFDRLVVLHDFISLDLFEKAATAFERTVFASAATPAFRAMAEAFIRLNECSWSTIRPGEEMEGLTAETWNMVELARESFCDATTLLARVAEAYMWAGEDEDQLLNDPSNDNEPIAAPPSPEAARDIDVESLEGDTASIIEIPESTEESNRVRSSLWSTPIPAPPREECEAALVQIGSILRPPRDNGLGHKAFDGDELTRTRLLMMEMLLRMYSSPPLLKSLAMVGWIEASWDVAHLHGKSTHTAKRLRQWTRAFLKNPENLPQHLYGTWKSSMLANEDFADELKLHLQIVGKYVSARDIRGFQSS
ncbi:hypothetical protein EWM64_g9104 [Hericium alpestre]|uniref:Uncharacterized protein n=1 Tax=Hericium alpestre TaxID=135208 RepID=A0A4Y9ZLD4_9AGAM|nr:hypothetical protein EWM64_g9104 [Hericium alpestre]